MTPLLDLRPPSATPGSLLRWVSTSNPFYVLSAALFLPGLVLTGWLGVACFNGYQRLRLIVAGLDQIALSLAVFAVAILVSVRKSGVLARR